MALQSSHLEAAPTTLTPYPRVFSTLPQGGMSEKSEGPALPKAKLFQGWGPLGKALVWEP
jgi:hypothetical protein